MNPEPIHRKPIETPASIVESGMIHTGIFRRPFRNVNLVDAEIFGPGRLFKPLRRFRLKEWIGFGIIHPEWYLCFFMQDAKYASSASFFALDLDSGNQLDAGILGPGVKVSMSDNQWDGRCVCSSMRRDRIEFHHNLDHRVHIVSANIKAKRKHPDIRAELTFHENFDALQPLVASMPLSGGLNAYTHKAAMPAGGYVSIGDTRIDFLPARDIAIMDEHRSFLPYRSAWKWATFAGRGPGGHIVGLNIGDHDTIQDQEKWNENCIWTGNRITFLGRAEFDFSHERHMEPWTIRESGGRAEVTFYPVADFVRTLEAAAIGMRYFQPRGTFRGFLVDDAGQRHEIDDYFGVAEMMTARW